MKNFYNIVKVLVIAIITMVASINPATAQIRTTLSEGNGDNCWLIEAGGVALFDKAPDSGEATVDFGAELSLRRKISRLNIIGGGRYIKGRSDIKLGLGVDLAKTSALNLRLEGYAKMSEQYLGFNWDAILEGQTSGEAHLNYYDNKFRLGAEGRIVLEYRDQRWSFQAFGGVDYRAYEGSKLNTEPNVDFGDTNVSSVVNNLPFKTDKVAFTAGVKISFAFFTL